jgi:hypothetical protein
MRKSSGLSLFKFMIWVAAFLAPIIWRLNCYTPQEQCNDTCELAHLNPGKSDNAIFLPKCGCGLPKVDHSKGLRRR